MRLWQKAQALLLFFIGLALPAVAQVASTTTPDLQKIDVDEHPGETIPLDLKFRNAKGDSVTLARYFGQGKPVILTLVYYECPMLCTLVLNGLTNAVQEIPLTPGQDFQLVTVSIDARETPELAAQKKHRYLQSLQRPEVHPDSWAFLVGDSTQSGQLARALGFRYFYVQDQDIFAHPAVLFLLTQDGVISRYFYGLEYNPRDLRLGLLEAAEGKIGSTLDKLILYCYHYDPESKGYVLFATNLMRLGGILTVILLVVFLGLLWAKDRFR